MKRKIFLPLLFSVVFSLLSLNVNACNYSFISIVGTPVDNGDGTFTVTVQIAIGLVINWGGTTNFTLTPVGGTFTTISSFSPNTLTSNYFFCPLCSISNASCDSSVVNVTATADGTLNGPQTIINYSQSSSFPAAGCTPPTACWGNGFPFVADDYQTVCDSANQDYLVWNITITTNGLPAFISINGLEDDIGPDVMSSGGCPEGVAVNLLTSLNEIPFDVTNNHFLSLTLPSPSSFTLNIFSADGKKVSQKNYSLSSGHHQLSLPTQNLAQGIYFCRVAGEGVNKSFKFVKH